MVYGQPFGILLQIAICFDLGNGTRHVSASVSGIVDLGGCGMMGCGIDVGLLEFLVSCDSDNFVLVSLDFEFSSISDGMHSSGV